MAALASAIMAGSAMSTAYAQSQAERSQGEYQQRISQINAEFAGLQADQAIRRGDKQAAQITQQGDKIRGAQRAAAAASGVDVNSGDAARLQNETAVLSQRDAQQAKANAWMEAWGYRQQAMEQTYRGNYARMAGDYSARATLLTGGMKALGYAADGFGKSGGGSKNELASYTSDNSGPRVSGFSGGGEYA